MPHPALGLEGAQIGKQAAVKHGFQIVRIVHAVQKAHVRIRKAKRLRLPFKGAANGLKIPRPAVGSIFIERAEVYLQKRVFAPSAQRVRYGLKRSALGGGKVKIVHTALERRLHHGHGVLTRLVQRAGTHADDADFLAAVRQNSVLHAFPFFCRNCAAIACRAFYYNMKPAFPQPSGQVHAPILSFSTARR